MGVRVIHGDCRDILPTLAAGSVQCCVTSPPYLGLRDYGVAGQIGLEPTPDAYITELVAVFRLVRRVLRDDGTLWLNLGDSFAGKQLLLTPARVALALQADGWWLRSDIIWHKPNPMPEPVTDRPTSAHEHVFLLAKQPRYFFDAEAVREEADATRAGILECSFSTSDPTSTKRHDVGRSVMRTPYRNCRNVWTIATAPYAAAHFATFPPELAERCIKAGTSERGCCAACGAPWVRQTERTASVLARSGDWKATGADHRNDIERKGGFYDATATTTGWAPSCGCDAAVVPCTVLDPFAGAGTTGLVADRLGRDAVLIELSPAYTTMAAERITDDCPLFAEVAD